MAGEKSLYCFVTTIFCDLKLAGEFFQTLVQKHIRIFGESRTEKNFYGNFHNSDGKTETIQDL